MRNLWVLSALLLSLATSSYAVVKGPGQKNAKPEQVCCFDNRWTGFTVGLTAGGMINASEGAIHPGGAFLLPANSSGNDQRNVTFDMGGGAFVGGVQIGYNYQMKFVVLGVETDFSYCSLSRTNEAAKTLVAPLSGTLSHNVTQLYNWFGTFRPRIGLVFKPVLIYATGGMVYGHDESRTSITLSANGNQFSGSQCKWPLGWTIGAGAEWGFTRHWSMKLEYLFVDMRKLHYNDPNSPAVNPTFSFKTSMKTEGHILRLGFNYTI